MLKSIYRKRTIFFRLLLFFVVLEMGTSYLYFQRSWEKGSATIWFVKKIAVRLKINEEQYKRIPDKEEFARLLKQLSVVLAKHNVSLSVLYIPTGKRYGNINRKFFAHTATRTNLCFIDAHDVVSASRYTYNLPLDEHLSSFGHALIAELLIGELSKCPSFKVETNKNYPLLFVGPNAKNIDSIDRYAGLAYDFLTDEHGFRSTLPYNEDQPVTIVIGDSFTFGTGVNTAQTFTHRLGNSHPNVLNAGMPGTSLIEQFQYIINQEEALRGVDNIILQVLDNDIVN